MLSQKQASKIPLISTLPGATHFRVFANIPIHKKVKAPPIKKINTECLCKYVYQINILKYFFDA